MRLIAITTLLLGLALGGAQGYYFASEAEDTDLSTLESSPGVAIIYPRSLGPKPEVKDAKGAAEREEASTATTTAAPTTTDAAVSADAPTTTAAPPTTTSTPTTAESGTAVEATSAATPAATSTTSVTPGATISANLPFGYRAAASVSVSDSSNPGVNRVWHFNNEGVNTNAVWFSPSSRSSPASSISSSGEAVEAVESNQAPVRVPAAASASVTSPFYRRQPILGDENEDASSSTNSLSKRFGAQSGRGGTFGEYRRSGEPDRTLYYPDIARIQANGAVASSASASAASASAVASSSNSFSSSSQSANYGTKGGAQSTNVWQQTERLTSPVKAVRRVVKSGGSQQVSGEEKIDSSLVREPVRVRVVVQKPSSIKSEFQNNYLERLQEANSKSSQAASASSSSFYTTTKQDQKDYVEVSARVVDTGVKSPPQPPPKPPTKSLPSPPPPPPRPPTKTIPRKPVYEQQTYEKYEEEQHPAPEPYSFNWQYGDETGNGQFRREEQSSDGVVRGSYGYTDAWGLYRIVDYVADKNGYRASIRTNEPGLVERSPVTNQVDEPAQVKISASETPQKVVELMRLTKPKPAYQ